MSRNDVASKNLLGSTLPPHLSGASPIAYYCGNIVWQNMLGAGQKDLDKKEEPLSIIDERYDELHQVVFAPSEQAKMAVENATYEDLNVRDENGNTPLMWAVLQGNEQMVQLLVDQGGAVNMQNFVGETALYIAAARGFERICTFLLQCGADARFTTLEGSSPLHIAAAGGHYGVVKILVGHGAFINAQDEEGDTPLHYAVREGKKEIIELLVQLGADFGLKNEDLESPLDLSIELEESAIASFLSTRDRKPNTMEMQSDHQLYFGEDHDMHKEAQHFIRTSVAFC